MIIIALCDDSAFFLDQASKQISDVLQDVCIDFKLAKFTTGSQLLAADPFDLVFLDIEMEGLDGLETARRLRARGDLCKLVFLTSHKQYVFSAFDVGAAHYLLKPLEAHKLREVLLRLCAKTEDGKQIFLTVKQGAETCRVLLAQILYIEVFGRKVSLHTINRVYDFYGKLEQLEVALPTDFFRCHRSYMVNLAHVCRYSKTEAILGNGEQVPIAKRKYPAFGKTFLAFLREGGVE